MGSIHPCLVSNWDFRFNESWGGSVVARTFKLNERINLKLLAEAFDLFNHPNFQQNNINNIQYTTTQAMDSAGNGLPFWAATANPGFGAPGAMAPRIGSRSFQFSGRISF
jgi:hypothetical protein